MKLKIVYDIIEEITGKAKSLSRTFSSLVAGVADEGLKKFAQAYVGLTNANEHNAYKIETKELA